MSMNRRTDGHSSCGKESTFVMPANFSVSSPLLILSAEVVWLPDRSRLGEVEGEGRGGVQGKRPRSSMNSQKKHWANWQDAVKTWKRNVTFRRGTAV